MKNVIVKTFEFNELSKEAKRVAVDEVMGREDGWYLGVYGIADSIGCDIRGFSLYSRSCDLDFLSKPEEIESIALSLFKPSDKHEDIKACSIDREVKKAVSELMYQSSMKYDKAEDPIVADYFLDSYYNALDCIEDINLKLKNHLSIIFLKMMEAEFDWLMSHERISEIPDLYFYENGKLID